MVDPRGTYRIRFMVLIALVAGAASPTRPAGAGEPTLAEEAARIDGAKLGATLEIDEPLRFGRAEIVLAKGSARELLAGTKRCGIVISGTARLTYTIDDEMTVPVAAYNLGTAVDQEDAVKKGRIAVHRMIDSAVLWSWSFDEPTPIGTAEPPRADLPEWAAEILEAPFFRRPSALMLEAAYNDNPGVVYALLKADDQRFLIGYDPELLGEESLYVVDAVGGTLGGINRGRSYLHELATQPVGRPWHRHPWSPLVTIDTDLHVDNTEGRHLQIRTRARVRATRTAGLWAVRLVDRVLEDNTARPVEVTSVTVNGLPAQHIHRGGELLVKIEPPLRDRSVAVIEVEHEGPLAVRPRGDNYWTLGTWAWYPQGDLSGEHSTFDISVRVPLPLTPFASGSTVSRETKDGFTTVTTRLDRPMQRPVVAAGEYHVISETKDGITCSVATYGRGSKIGDDRLLNNFFAAVRFYELLFGVPYPFAEVNIIERNTWGFGQAPAGVIFITKEAFDSVSTTMRRYFSQGVNQRFVHEIAHGWWGHLAKMGTYDEQWISEGIAQYAAAECIRAMHDKKKRGDREFESIIKHWNGRLKTLPDTLSVYLANHLAEASDDDRDNRYGLLYVKAPLVLHSLRLELRKALGSRDEGDEAFFTLLRSVLANFAYKPAETRHMIGILNQLTGDDWTPFFRRYIYGTEMPEVS